MHPVILVASLTLVVLGICGIVFNRRLDAWAQSKGFEIFPNFFRDNVEAAFGRPADMRTALVVSIGFLTTGLLMLAFGPVVS